MALTIYEGAKLSRNPLAAGLMLALATSDELISQLPMVPTPGESFVYNREGTLPSAEFVAPDHSSIAESSATFDRVTVPLRLLVTDIDTYLFNQVQASETNPQDAVQMALKLKAVGRTIAQKAITGAYASGATFSAAVGGTTVAQVGPHQDSSRHGPGDLKYVTAGTLMSYRAPGDRQYGTAVNVGANGTYTLRSDNPNRYLKVTIVAASLPGANVEVNVTVTTTSNEPEGLKILTPDAQTILSTGANGDALSFDVLDQLIDEKVKVRNRLVFVMNSKLKRKFYGLARALGGVGIETTQLPGVVGPVPSYRGIPILQNDWISSDEVKGGGSTLSSVWLMDLSEEGFHARVGQGGSAMDVSADPRNARVMGLMVRDIGELEAKEARRRRVSWYGSFALGSELAVARASQLVTA